MKHWRSNQSWRSNRSRIGGGRARTAGRALVAGLVVAAAGSIVVGAPPMHSTFDRGDEGWIVADLSCSNYNSVLGTYDVSWFASGGHPGGHIGRFDPSNNCYFFDAPAAFMGDQSSRIGGELHFSLRTTEIDWPPGRVVVLIGNNTVLVHMFAAPSNQWQRFIVPLVASSFRLNTADGPKVSDQQFAAAMADLEVVRISAEHGAVVEETTWLDSVCLRDTVCPADLNCDDAVNVFDLLALLSAWGANPGHVADLSGDGSVDVFDLLALLGAWGTCS